MKENRFGPRQWAFVVIAGGAVCALPFTQSRSQALPSPQTEVDTSYLPEVPTVAQMPVPALPVSQAQTSDGVVAQTSSSGQQVVQSVAASNVRANVPAGVELRHSPFDDLIRAPASAPAAVAPPDALPLQPMRPWISAPPNNMPKASEVASTTVSGANVSAAIAASAPLASSPWRDDASDGLAQAATPRMAYKPKEKQLPADAWPDEAFSDSQIAQKAVPPDRGLVSAVMTPEQVSASLSPPTITRQTAIVRSNAAQPNAAQPNAAQPNAAQPKAAQPKAAQVRFGQTHQPTATPVGSPEYAPLPVLPETRRSHVIFQPDSPLAPRK